MTWLGASGRPCLREAFVAVDAAFVEVFAAAQGGGGGGGGGGVAVVEGGGGDVAGSGVTAPTRYPGCTAAVALVRGRAFQSNRQLDP